MVRVKNARSLLKDDATLSGILHYSGLRPVAALHDKVMSQDGARIAIPLMNAKTPSQTLDENEFSLTKS